MLTLVLLLALTQDQQTVSDGIPSLANSIAKGITREHKPKVAVLPFVELQGPRTAFGTYIAEALTTALVNQNVDVIERAAVERVMEKLGIASSADIDAEAAKAIGAETRVEAIIVGTIADMQAAIAVNGRVRDAASGRIITAAEVLLAKDGTVEGLLAQLLPGANGAPPPAGGASDGPEPRNLTWTDGGAKITIDTRDRKRNSVELWLMFVNTTSKPLKVSGRRYTLTDENGDEYAYGFDSEEFVTRGATIPAGRSARSAFKFVCRAGSCDGTTFVMKDESGAVVVRNLKVEP